MRLLNRCTASAPSFIYSDDASITFAISAYVLHRTRSTTRLWVTVTLGPGVANCIARKKLSYRIIDKSD